MKQIVSIVALFSTLTFADFDMGSMFDKAKDAVSDINMTDMMDKAKDAVKDINVTKAIDKAKVAVEDINVTKMIDKAKDKVDEINVTKMIDKAKDAVSLEFSWQDDLSKAFDMAKDADKRIMVMVESDDCRWCKKLLHRTIADDGVQKKLAQQYVSVRVQREDLETMKNLPSVRGVPTVFFMDQEKNVIEEVIGYFDVLDFTSYMKDVDKKVSQKEQTLKTGN